MSIITTDTQVLSDERAELVKKAHEYKLAALSPNTWRTYRSMWGKFLVWCQMNNAPSLPTRAETISLYLSTLAETVSFSTIDATIAAIEKVHKENGAEINGNAKLYRDVRRGIRRKHSEKLKQKQAKALSVVDLKIACRLLGESLKDKRDQAVILLGYWGAFRRSELSAIKVEHVEFNEEGAAISLMGSKSSDKVEIVYVSKTHDMSVCPVEAIKSWMEAARIQEGSLFRGLIKGGSVSDKPLSGHSVGHIMKRIFGEDYSGHSLRRGIITEVAKAGTPVHEIQKFSRHRSVDMVLRYTERARGFDSTTGKALGV